MVSGDNVYLGGGFTNAGGNPDSDYLARWDGDNYHAIGSGLNSYVLTLTAAGNNLYVGGNFTDAGGKPSKYFAIWHSLFTLIDNVNPINPVNFSLKQNYPNPFNPITIIPFELAEVCKVKINFYNILGQKVLELEDKIYQAGSHRVYFDGGNLSSGAYIVQVEMKPQNDQSQTYRFTKKIMLMK